MKRLNGALIAAALVIAVVPLLGRSGADFNGSDSEGMTAIASLAPGYQPWFKPLWQPPSTEVESLLFALQAALGAGVLGYYLGYRRGRREQNRAGD